MGNSASRQPVAYANVEADEADQQQVTIEVHPATEQARTGAGGIGATSTVSVAALLDDSDVPERARYHEDEEEEYDDEEDEDEEDDNEEDDEEDEEHYDNERAGRQRTTPMTGAATATQQQQQQQQRTQAMHAMEPFLMNARDRTNELQRRHCVGWRVFDLFSADCWCWCARSVPESPSQPAADASNADRQSHGQSHQGLARDRSVAHQQRLLHLHFTQTFGRRPRCRGTRFHDAQCD